MNNLRVTLNKNLKPYSKYIPEINKPTLRAILKGKKIILKKFKQF